MCYLYDQFYSCVNIKSLLDITMHSSQIPIPVIDKRATFPTLLQTTLYVDRFAKYPVENIAIQMIKKLITDDIATILEDRYGLFKD